MAAIDIEEEVTQTIEAALSGLYNIRNMRSVSRDDISMVYLEFSWDADMDLTFIKVRNKLDRIQKLLPDFAARPTILRFDPSSSPFMMLAVTGDRIERPVSDEDYRAALVELKDVAKAIVKPRLEQIQGVAQALRRRWTRKGSPSRDRPPQMSRLWCGVRRCRGGLDAV